MPEWLKGAVSKTVVRPWWTGGSNPSLSAMLEVNMEKRNLPKSVRKFIRQEKARIRHETNSPDEEKKRIEDLLNRFVPR